MAKKPDNLAGFEADDAGGVLNGLLAEENELDRRALWRLASWGVGATGAVVLAVMANQSSLGVRRDQVAAADLTQKAQQIQTVARETQSEARRLAAAIETLNMDRDRLYSRVTSLEQGMDSVTGTIARQGSAATSPPAARAEPQTAPSAPSPAVAPVATAPAAPAADKSTSGEPGPAPPAAAAKEAAKSDAARTENTEPEPAAKADLAKPKAAKPSPATPSPTAPLMASRSMMAPPDPAAGRLIEPADQAPGAVIASPLPDVVASTSSEAETEDDNAPKALLQRTEFGIDLGTANSVNGLRALWRGLLKSRSNAPLVGLRPIIVIKEGTNGLGMQLRLVAGPLNDAGAAARICAVLTENNRHCETAIFDGQRLSVKPDEPPVAAKPPPRRRGAAKRPAAVVEEAQPKPDAPPAATQSTLSSIFNRKNQQ